MTGDGCAAGGDADGGVGSEAWTPAEQALLEAALDFYGAAGGVIDFAGNARPQLRHDAVGFKAIRRAMETLEERVASAHAAGTSPERIAQITRMEQETIDLIVQRRSAAPGPGGD